MTMRRQRTIGATRAVFPLAAMAALLGLAPGPAHAQTPPGTVEVRAGEGRLQPSGSPGHEGHQCYTRDGSIDTGKIRYGLRYCACWDPSHGGGAAPVEGYIGMPEPNACNWYHSGFLRLVVNGQDLGSTKLSDLYASETGERGSLTMLWKSPQGPVRVRFLALPNDDRLFCELALDPTEEVTALQVALLCYPSFFTAWEHRDGMRRVTTAAREEVQGKTLEAKPAEEWWLAYTDDVFDPAKLGEAAGGCGLLFDPKQIRAATVGIGSYAVNTTLVVDPTVRTIRLVFWDFNKRPNAEAIQALRQGADGTLGLLRRLDFAPLAVTSFDLAARVAAVAAELKNVTDPKDFPARFEALNRKLEPLLTSARQARAASQAASVETEKSIADLMGEYATLEWELKFHVLLND
jgi:hypothetical protein